MDIILITIRYEQFNQKAYYNIFLHLFQDTMDFAFTGVLDQNINQEEVFDLVAKPVVLK